MQQPKCSVRRPVLPSLTRDDKCCICLDTIAGPTFANECLHAVCRECIFEWVSNHNRCPMCRCRIRFVCVNVRSNIDYDVFEVLPDVVQHDSVVEISSLFAYVMPSDDTGLYMVEVRQT